MIRQEVLNKRLAYIERIYAVCASLDLIADLQEVSPRIAGIRLQATKHGT